jgi:hypothetical protein
MQGLHTGSGFGRIASHLKIVSLSALVALCLSGGLNPACSAESASADSPQWISGGVTGDERHVMQSKSSRYTLWLVTAVRGGEYLSDVHVSIRDEKGVLVFDQLLDGPWLMVDLPQGLYNVVATSNGQRLSRQLKVTAGKPARTHLHFAG